jgi:hypothetical protein
LRKCFLQRRNSKGKWITFASKDSPAQCIAELERCYGNSFRYSFRFDPEISRRGWSLKLVLPAVAGGTTETYFRIIEELSTQDIIDALGRASKKHWLRQQNTSARLRQHAIEGALYEFTSRLAKAIKENDLSFLDEFE